MSAMNDHESLKAYHRAAEEYMVGKADAEDLNTPFQKTPRQVEEQFHLMAKYKPLMQVELTEEQKLAVEAFRKSADDEMDRLRNPPLEQRFARIVGEDYAGCRLETFQIAPDWHKEATAQAESVLRRLRLISGSVREAVKAGTGLVLCGAPGVGKDHLAAAVMWSALSAGLSCKWTNGGKFAASAMDQFSDDRQLDRIWLEDWTKPDVLTISDPDGNRQQGLTDHVRDTLYKVVDARVRDGKPTWITINGSDSKVWIDRLGARTWDRLVNKAWVLHCSWPGHRKMRAELR